LLACRCFSSRAATLERVIAAKNRVGVYAEESLLTDGHPDPEKVNPFVLSMPDNRFWGLGDCVGRAWHEGKSLKK